MEHIICMSPYICRDMYRMNLPTYMYVCILVCIYEFSRMIYRLCVVQLIQQWLLVDGRFKSPVVIQFTGLDVSASLQDLK